MSIAFTSSRTRCPIRAVAKITGVSVDQSPHNPLLLVNDGAYRALFRRTVRMSLRRPALSFRASDFKIAAFPTARDRPEKRKLKRNPLVVWNHDFAVVDAQVGRCRWSVCGSRPVVEREMNLECVLGVDA